jgi:hypothetical protein
MSRFIQFGGYMIGNPTDKLSYMHNDSDSDNGNDSDSDNLSINNYEENGVQTQNDNDIESTRQELVNAKTNYYNYLMDNAPEPLDQNPCLTDIVKSDMRLIAKILNSASENGFQQTPYFFKSSVTSVSNSKNLTVPPEELEKYSASLKQKGLECIVNCRESLHALNSKSTANMNACQDMIQDIFVTYMWSLTNTAKDEE